MLIGIISDTHDNLPNTQKAIQHFNDVGVELVLHLGDWSSPTFAYVYDGLGLTCKTISVFGNNDGDIGSFLADKEKGEWNIEFYFNAHAFNLEDKKVVLYHGKSPIIVESLLHCGLYDVVFTGHTHIAHIQKIKKTLHINPGTTNGLLWNKTVVPSVAIYDTEKNKGNIIFLSNND